MAPSALAAFCRVVQKGRVPLKLSFLGAVECRAGRVPLLPPFETALQVRVPKGKAARVHAWHLTRGARLPRGVPRAPYAR